MRAIFSIFLILAFSSTSAAQQIEAFLCIPDKATGFKYNETSKQWEETTFKTDHKYLITRPSHQSLNINSAWVVKEFGSELVSMWCEDDFDEFGFLFCKSYEAEMRFNRENSRFLYFYSLGYYNKKTSAYPEDGGGTPLVEIGTCSKL